MPRTIIFGDIHGCYEEWRDLLDTLSPAADDRLIAVGDLCCKGPSTKTVLDMAMSMPNLRCIMGNHDFYLLHRWQNHDLPHLKAPYQHVAIRELGADIDRYMRFIETWPYYLELDECLAVHAGIRPGIPLAKQDVKDLLHLRTLEPDFHPWYQSYKEKRLIVHGHWARQGLVVRKNVIGLDTGCVYGHELTAVVLPERKIVSVKARKAYVPVD